MSAWLGGNVVMTVQKPEGYHASPGFRRQAGLNSSFILAGCGVLDHLVLFARFYELLFCRKGACVRA